MISCYNLVSVLYCWETNHLKADWLKTTMVYIHCTPEFVTWVRNGRNVSSLSPEASYKLCHLGTGRFTWSMAHSHGRQVQMWASPQATWDSLQYGGWFPKANTPREQTGRIRHFYDLTWKAAKHSFHHILVVKHITNPAQTQGKGTVFTSSGRAASFH